MDQERDLLAAEYALGLLGGEAREEAARLMLADGDFRRAVEGWQLRFAQLAETVPPAEPPADGWERIERALSGQAGEDKVVRLNRRVRLWQGLTGAAGALAASLALILVLPDRPPAPLPPAPQPAPQEQAPTLVAGLAPAPDASVALSVAYEPRGRSLIVNAAALDRTAQRDHQLWIIPAGGQPVALGLVRGGGRHRLEVPRELTPHFRSESVVAVSLEPLGGSPTGQPTGPVLASGPLLQI